MAQITPEQRALLRIAQVPAGCQRRYEASPAEATPDDAGYIQGVTAIIVPPRGFTLSFGTAGPGRPAIPARRGIPTGRREHPMSAEWPVAVTDADVRSLAAKLTGLYALLTPPEQEVLHTLLHRAAAAETDLTAETGGLLWGVSFNPFTYLDAIDFGTSSRHGIPNRQKGGRR